MVIIEKLKSIADAIRARTGGTEPLTLDEMAEAIESMEVADDDTNTYILVDENGYEVPAVLVDEEVTLTATPNDIRIGATAVTEQGVVTGEKEIPGYITTEGKRVVKTGDPLEILMFSDKYKYSKLLVLVCEYNTTVTDSVSAVMVVINNHIYEAGSTTPLAEVTVDSENQSINLGLINESDKSLVMRYMSIKENA